MTYHLQTDGSSEHTNQMVEIALCFFIHAMDNLFCWLEVLPQIQLLLNHTFSLTAKKMPNKVAYRFSLRRPLDLYLAVILPNTYVAYTEASDAIFFTFAN